MSEDPMFWGGLSQRSLLNPQRLNSYSYARDNPVKRKDPSGLYDINTGLIQKGDTLSAIASQINKAWGTTYTTSSLAAENGISNVNLIYAGNYIYYTMPGVVGGSSSAVSSENGSLMCGATGSVIVSSDLSPNLPSEVQVTSSKYGFSETVSRDFSQIIDDLNAGKLEAGSIYKNVEKLLQFSTGTWQEYRIETPEMNMPNKAGPERLLIEEETGAAYYTGSHYQGEFLNLETGELIPGEGMLEIPPLFLP